MGMIEFPLSAGFFPYLPYGKFLCLIYASIIYFCFLYFIFRPSYPSVEGNHLPHQPLLHFLFFFFLIYAFSRYYIFHGHLIQSRFFYPFWWIAMMLFGIFSANRRRGFILIFGIIFLGILSFVKLGTIEFKKKIEKNWAYLFQISGHSYWQLGARWGETICPDYSSLTRCLEIVKKYPPTDQKWILWGLSSSSDFWSNLSIDETIQWIDQQPKTHHAFLWENLGQHLSQHRHLSLTKLQSKIENSSNPYAEFGISMAHAYFSLSGESTFNQGGIDKQIGEGRWFYFHLGYFLYQMAPHQVLVTLSHLGENTESTNWMLKGLGKAIAQEWVTKGLHDSWIKRSHRKLGITNDANILWGVGWELRNYFREDTVRASQWLKWIPEELKGKVMEGFQSSAEWYAV